MTLHLRWPARAAVSVVSVTALLLVAPVDQVAAAVGSVSAGQWTAVVALFLGGHLIAALKWRRLMPVQGRLPVAACIRSHFAGLLANLFLPGVAGGDLVRAAAAMRGASQPAGLGVACLADRLIDCGALLLLVLAGMAWTGSAAAGDRGVLAGAAAIVLSAAVGAFVVARHARARSPRIEAALGATRQLVARPLDVTVALALSMVVQGLFVALNAWLGASVGVDAGPAAWLVAWPLAKLTALVPVSLAGFGVRELALVAYMQPFGAAAAPVMASGLMWDAVLVCGSALGWVMTVMVPADLSPRRRRLAPTRP